MNSKNKLINHNYNRIHFLVDKYLKYDCYNALRANYTHFYVPSFNNMTQLILLEMRRYEF